MSEACRWGALGAKSSPKNRRRLPDPLVINVYATFDGRSEPNDLNEQRLSNADYKDFCPSFIEVFQAYAVRAIKSVSALRGNGKLGCGEFVQFGVVSYLAPAWIRLPIPHGLPRLSTTPSLPLLLLFLLLLITIHLVLTSADVEWQ